MSGWMAAWICGKIVTTTYRRTYPFPSCDTVWILTRTEILELGHLSRAFLDSIAVRHVWNSASRTNSRRLVSRVHQEINWHRPPITALRILAHSKDDPTEPSVCLYSSILPPKSGQLTDNNNPRPLSNIFLQSLSSSSYSAKTCGVGISPRAMHAMHAAKWLGSLAQCIH